MSISCHIVLDPSDNSTLPGKVGAEALVIDRGGRAPEIDAIRGWAALSVVCFHVFWETFGVTVPWLRSPYTAALIAGHFDVILFFILSGDALSFPFFHGGGTRYLQRAALKRYPRLTLPIATVTAMTALAMAFGLTPTGPASEIVGRTDWLGTFAAFKPSGKSAVRFAFYFVYEGNYSFNYLPFLWTMPIEMLGSLLLLLVLFVYRNVRCAGWLVAGLAFVLLKAESYTGCFLVGLLLSKARVDGVYRRLPTWFKRIAAPIGIPLTLALIGQRQSIGDPNLLQLSGLGTTLLFCLYACNPAVRWLSQNSFSQFLGRISYLLYLWHFFVLVTLTSGLIVVAGEGGVISTTSALAIGFLTVVVSVMVSNLTLFIEAWTRNINVMLLSAFWRDDEHPA